MKFLSVLILTLCCLYLVFAGLLLIPYAGFQHDEVVFAQPLFEHGLTFYSYQIGDNWIPIMINSYAGAFKTWIWWPIFAVWPPSVYSLRVPALLLAAFTLVMFWPIMERAGGRRAAAIATVLLATDSMYLMTSIFDWGPCILQHVFLIGVMLAFIRYHETSSPRMLALAGFLAGLALWEKALFFWLAGGLAVAAAAIYPKQIWQHMSRRNLIIATASFALGAGLFIKYNIHKPNATLGENATFSTEEFDGKVESARRTINAHAIFGYICLDDWVRIDLKGEKQPPRAPRNGLESASLALREATGQSQRSMMLWAYGLAILLTPFTWRTRAFRPMLFALIFCLVGWALMLITKGAGAYVHHVILLWPVTLMFLSLPFAEASRRLPARIGIPVLCVVVAYFAAENILAANQYLAQLIRNGPAVIWTDALFPLSNDLMQSPYQEIVGIDWGTTVPLEVLERRQSPLEFVGVDDTTQDFLLSKMDKPNVVFLGHVNAWVIDGKQFPIEVFPDVDEKLDALAAKKGYAKQVVKTYADGVGRPVFELFQYHPSSPPPAQPGK
jgi:hypothetical protein